jgi:hypothetical protein
MKAPIKYRGGIIAYPIFKSFAGLLEQTAVCGGLATSFLNTFIFDVNTHLTFHKVLSYGRY